MRIIVKREGITKILQQAVNLRQLLEFTTSNFPENQLLTKREVLEYLDIDGDCITISSQKDFEAMLETVTNRYVKLEIVVNSFYQMEFCGEFDLNDRSRSRIGSLSNSMEKTENCGVVDCSEENSEALSRITEKSFKISHNQTPIISSSSVDHQIESRKCQQLDKTEGSPTPDQSKTDQGLHINDSVSELIEDRIKVLIEEKVQQLMPSLRKVIQKEVEENYSKDMAKSQQMLGGSEREPEMNFKKVKKTKCQHRARQQQIIQQNAKIKITEQCFKLSKVFGQAPEHYETFVSENFGLKTNRLRDLYAKDLERLNNSHAKSQDQKRLLDRANKLSFYFGQGTEKYRCIVKENPKLNFKELVSLLEHGSSSQRKELQKTDNVQLRTKRNYSEHFMNQPQKGATAKNLRISLADLQKARRSSRKTVHLGSQSERIIATMPLKPIRETNEIMRKAEFVILFKELFGSGDVMSYLKFYEENKELQQRQIVEKWISGHLQL